MNKSNKKKKKKKSLHTNLDELNNNQKSIQIDID